MLQANRRNAVGALQRSWQGPAGMSLTVDPAAATAPQERLPVVPTLEVKPDSVAPVQPLVRVARSDVWAPPVVLGYMKRSAEVDECS